VGSVLVPSAVAPELHLIEPAAVTAADVEDGRALHGRSKATVKETVVALERLLNRTASMAVDRSRFDAAWGVSPRGVDEPASRAAGHADGVLPGAHDEPPVLVVAERAVEVGDHVIVRFSPHRALQPSTCVRSRGSARLLVGRNGTREM